MTITFPTPTSRCIGANNGYQLHETSGAIYATDNAGIPVGVAWGPAADGTGEWFASRGEFGATRVADRAAAIDHITSEEK